MPDDARNEQIERAINREVAGALTIRQHGASTFLVAPRSMSEILEFAKLMSVSGICIRPMFRGNPGACLAVTLQAMKWGADPFAVANKAFVVNDQIAYEAQLIHAIVNSSPVLEERLHASYLGDGQQRQCLVTGMIVGAHAPREYLSPKIGDITPKNSPLWKTDPDQQLFYYSTRAWARRWVPETLLGIYSPDELTVDHEPPPRPTRAQFADERQERLERLATDPIEDSGTGQDRPQAATPIAAGGVTTQRTGLDDGPPLPGHRRRRRRTKAEMEAARAADAAALDATTKSYTVVDSDGEIHEFDNTIDAANFLGGLFTVAAQSGQTAIDALGEDNGALLYTLSTHDPVAFRLVTDGYLLPARIAAEEWSEELATDPATTEHPQGTDDAPEPDRQAPPELPSAPPAQAPAGPRPDYRIVPHKEKTGEVSRAWWVALLQPTLRKCKTQQAFDDCLSDNADTIADYMGTLQPPTRILAMKELDDIKREIPA